MSISTKSKIRKGDRVVVRTGRDKGKTGEVLRVVPLEARAFVQGVNMVKRHTRPSMQNPGGIVEKEGPIHLSNLALVDPKDGKATRVRFEMLGDKKVRVAARSGEKIDG